VQALGSFVMVIVNAVIIKKNDMRTIIAPTDFSAVSLNAVQYAADMAVAAGKELSVIHVYQLPMAFSEMAVSAESVEEVVSAAEEQLGLLRDKLKRKTAGKLTIHISVLRGDVLTEISDYADTVNTYAIVMGAEKAGSMERFLLGGKTTSAVKHLSSPLIIVPAGAKFAAVKKIGLACDFIDVERTVPVKEIRSFVHDFNAELHILHVSTNEELLYSDKTIEASEWLQESVKELNPRYHFIKSKAIEEAIDLFAMQNKIDLLVIIPKRHSAINRLLNPTHSQKIVLKTHVPVMTIHE
jgi:nucleotide-binding universal stress UspA family protein